MRVENACERGTPDLFLMRHICGVVFPLWIECKTANTSETENRPLTGMDISQDQKRWHSEFTRLSGLVSYFLIQVGSGKKARRYLVPGDWVSRHNYLTESLLKIQDTMWKFNVC